MLRTILNAVTVLVGLAFFLGSDLSLAQTPVPTREPGLAVTIWSTEALPNVQEIPIQTWGPLTAPIVTPQPLLYNLPTAILTAPTALYASPNNARSVVHEVLPAGEVVYVMGRTEAASHLRVVREVGVGWIPTSFTSYNGHPERLEVLPVLIRVPPACAEPLSTQFGLNSEWTNDRTRRIAIVVDLYRSRIGDFPASSLVLALNGTEVENTRHEVGGRGQFLLKSDLFLLPQDVQPGDRVGYVLDTTSSEPLTFVATIFTLNGGDLCGSLGFAWWSDFAVKHERETMGEQSRQVISYQTKPALDNSRGTLPVQVQVEFRRDYERQIVVWLDSNQVSVGDVQAKITEFYKLPTGAPGSAVGNTSCTVLVMVPPGRKARVTVEWTERWAEGVIIEGYSPRGNRLGTYQALLGYVEPCSVFRQENIP